MWKRSALFVSTVFLAAPRAAHAEFITTVHDVYGTKYLALSGDALFWITMLVLVILLLGLAEAASSASPSTSCDMPEEIEPPTDTAEHYEQEAVRLRALARKLDAETAFKESEMRAKIKEEELKEIHKLLRTKSKAPRGT